jgi:hypothetical protein
MTGLSRAQVARLISDIPATRRILEREYADYGQAACSRVGYQTSKPTERIKSSALLRSTTPWRKR